MHATRLDVIEQQQRRRTAKRDALLSIPTALAAAWLAYAVTQFFI